MASASVAWGAVLRNEYKQMMGIPQISAHPLCQSPELPSDVW